MRKQSEKRQRLYLEILQLINSNSRHSNIVQDIIKKVKKYTGVDAVGVRLQEGCDYPYYFTDGFSNEFIKAERYLCQRDKDGAPVMDKNGNVYLECICGDVISGRTNLQKPFFTKGGSFWTNNTIQIASTSEKDGLIRARCNEEGYESVAIVPLKNADTIIGLLQLNDKRTDRFTLDFIEFLESLGASIGIALASQKAEEDLIKHRDHLEEMVKERTNELEIAINELKETTNAKSIFLANMSHELRTPLNSIMGFSEVLKDELFGTLNDKQKEYVGFVNASGNHFLELINDILDISKVESGKVDLDKEGFSLKSDLLEPSLCMLREGAMKRNVRLILEVKPEADIKLNADLRRLKQVMFNLLSNAVKFTPDNGIITINARQSETKDSIEISVRDTGIGMKKEDMSKLFKPFSQVKSELSYKGTGLGLALTRKLV